MHIHQWGDITGMDGKTTGGHYNPKSHDHGLPEKHLRHAGDLGNLQADASGKAKYELTVDNLSIAGSKNPIVGRGVIIHAKKDDGGQPTGNAGARIAQGVIGIRKPAE
jgi:Cu-Zn family superoxide dismutase